MSEQKEPSLFSVDPSTLLTSPPAPAGNFPGAKIPLGKEKTAGDTLITGPGTPSPLVSPTRDFLLPTPPFTTPVQVTPVGPLTSMDLLPDEKCSPEAGASLPLPSGTPSLPAFIPAFGPSPALGVSNPSFPGFFSPPPVSSSPPPLFRLSLLLFPTLLLSLPPRSVLCSLFFLFPPPHLLLT